MIHAYLHSKLYYIYTHSKLQIVAAKFKLAVKVFEAFLSYFRDSTFYLRGFNKSVFFRMFWKSWTCWGSFWGTRNASTDPSVGLVRLQKRPGFNRERKMRSTEHIFLMGKKNPRPWHFRLHLSFCNHFFYYF